jgi:uncharacterized protein YutE (UPF0331/DUF86 family)
MQILLELQIRNILEALAEKLSAAASFRNFLVHVYEQIDTRILKKFLMEDLEDFDLFVSYVIEHIEKSGIKTKKDKHVSNSNKNLQGKVTVLRKKEKNR